MNLLYDLIASQPMSDADFHGGGKYAKKVFIEICKNYHPGGGLRVYALFDSRKPLDDDILLAADQSGIDLLDMAGSDVGMHIQRYSINRYYSALPYNIGFNFFDLLR